MTSGEERRVAIVVARFNSMITEQLLEGARHAFHEAGISDGQVAVFHVPGAWELPQMAQRVIRTGRFSAVVTLGCVIRGETAHFDFVAGGANDGLGAVALDADIPVIFGVLTTETPEQAMVRADVRGADKGGEAARAALEMMELHERL